MLQPFLPSDDGGALPFGPGIEFKDALWPQPADECFFEPDRIFELYAVRRTLPASSRSGSETYSNDRGIL